MINVLWPTNPNLAGMIYDVARITDEQKLLIEWHSWKCVDTLIPQKMSGGKQVRLPDSKRQHFQQERIVLLELNKVEYLRVISALDKMEKNGVKGLTLDEKQEWLVEGFGYAPSNVMAHNDPEFVLQQRSNELQKIRADLVAWFAQNGSAIPEPEQVNQPTEGTINGYSTTEEVERTIVEQNLYEKRLETWQLEKLHDELFRLKEQRSKEAPDGSKVDPSTILLSHTYRCIQSIRKEIKRREGLAREETDKVLSMEELTRKANQFAWKKAQQYKKETERIPYDAIAEEAMREYFAEVISRETGKVHRNGDKELTNEWKRKREAIRGTLRDKLKHFRS
jgi:hypothetical protein